MEVNHTEPVEWRLYILRQGTELEGPLLLTSLLRWEKISIKSSCSELVQLQEGQHTQPSPSVRIPC